MDDDLWEVALPSGEVKRMTLDQLDRAFQVGLIHSNTLVREGSGGDWQTLGAMAGLEDAEPEPATMEPATTRADPAAETKRNSVLPAPPEDDDPNRETLAGLGGFLAVGPAGAAPGVGSRTPPVAANAFAPRAATLPMGAPSPVVVSQGAPAVGRAPVTQAIGMVPLPVNAFGPVATVSPPSTRPPPLPANAFVAAAQAAVTASPIIPTASVQRSVAPPAGQPTPLGSAPPPPRRSGPPPLPPGAFSPRPPEAAPAPPASLSQPPRVSAAKASAPLPQIVSAPMPAPSATAGGHSPRLGNALIGVFALLTLLVILQRNGILFGLFSTLGLGDTYLGLERSVIGPPSVLTPRGVEQLGPLGSATLAPESAATGP